MNIHYNQATFMLSAAKLAQLPPDQGYEIAFAGRSNAGKSSALNTITDINGLARTSKTPGRTQLINLFKLDDERRLVDLPGYGYAKVAASTQRQWQQTLSDYLQQRQCLRGLVLIMDIRHPLKALDQHMINWCQQANLPMHILLTKADKLSRGAGMNVLQQVKHTLQSDPELLSIQLFSSLKKTGVDLARQQLTKWFNEPQRSLHL